MIGGASFLGYQQKLWAFLAIRNRHPCFGVEEGKVELSVWGAEGFHCGLWMLVGDGDESRKIHEDHVLNPSRSSLFNHLNN